jgi:hypothetical protein
MYVPVIKIPDYIVRLCMLNLNEAKSNAGEFEMLVLQNSFLQILIEKLFTRGQYSSLRQLFLTHGLRAIRNILTLHFVASQLKALFNEHQFHLIGEILDFENNYEIIGANGNNRVFLLGFYLYLIKLKHGHDYLVLPNEIFKILKNGYSSQEHVDYLIMMTLSFAHEFGIETFLDKLKIHKGDFSKLVEDFEMAQREKFFTPLLSYSNSINKTELFAKIIKV